jgi:hypothetical protein
MSSWRWLPSREVRAYLMSPVGLVLSPVRRLAEWGNEGTWWGWI